LQRDKSVLQKELEKKKEEIAESRNEKMCGKKRIRYERDSGHASECPESPEG